MGEVGTRVERHGEGRGRGVRGDASSTEGEEGKIMSDIISD